jgi:hypothetical protein
VRPQSLFPCEHSVLQETFTKKVARAKDRKDGLFADFINNGQLYPTLLNVQDILGRIASNINLL